MSFRILNLQVALFFTQNIRRPDQFGQQINTSLGMIFDEVPMTIPLPEDAPAEIPACMMKSKEDIYSSNVARSRIDLFINGKARNYSSKAFCSIHKAQIINFINSCTTIQSVNRIGIVGVFFYSTSNSVGQILKKYIIKNSINNPSEITIRHNNILKIESLDVNNIVEIKQATLEVKDENFKSDGILITRDINNSLSENQLDNKVLERILDKFFDYTSDERMLKVVQ